MSNMPTLNKIFKGIEHMEQGLPADWDEISDSFDWYMAANYPNQCLMNLSEQEQAKVFSDLRKIKKGKDTI